VKQIVLFLVGIAALAGPANAQQSAIGDLSEFLFLVAEIGGNQWNVEYAYDSRTVKISSFGKIKGSDYGGGLPANNLADYPITICFRITSEPTEKRMQSLESLTQKKSDFVERMSDNVLGWSGYSKSRPQSLSKLEWAEYIEYAELKREVESLALPTHTFRSLYLVDVSQWHIRPSPDQSETGKEILAQRDEMLKLVTKFK
jgi:hypothetical protein